MAEDSLTHRLGWRNRYTGDCIVGSNPTLSATLGTTIPPDDKSGGLAHGQVLPFGDVGGFHNCGILPWNYGTSSPVSPGLMIEFGCPPAKINGGGLLQSHNQDKIESQVLILGYTNHTPDIVYQLKTLPCGFHISSKILHQLITLAHNLDWCSGTP